LLDRGRFPLRRFFGGRFFRRRLFRRGSHARRHTRPRHRFCGRSGGACHWHCQEVSVFHHSGPHAFAWPVFSPR
jgi:hypothetical protein